MISAPREPEVNRIAMVTAHPQPSRGSVEGDTSITAALTFTIWMGCLTVGWLGFSFPYARPQPPAEEASPIIAEVLQVELTSDPLPAPDTPLLPAPSQPPPLMEPMILPQPPPMIAVAGPTPAIAFALPVEGPVRIVEMKQADHTLQAKPVAQAPAPAPRPAVQPITYGQGEGKQPAPEYPRQAVREGQEGTVTVRFSVGEDGRVIAAEALSPSPWPLLNEAALRAVRGRWRFRPGPVRLYEVSIRFELKK
jgi:periplasmic protein TonB